MTVILPRDTDMPVPTRRVRVWDTDVGDRRVASADQRDLSVLLVQMRGSCCPGLVAGLRPDFVPAVAGFLAARGEDAGGSVFGPAHAR